MYTIVYKSKLAIKPRKITSTTFADALNLAAALHEAGYTVLRIYRNGLEVVIDE